MYIYIYIRAVCVVTSVAIVDIVSAIVIYSLVTLTTRSGAVVPAVRNEKKKKKTIVHR